MGRWRREFDFDTAVDIDVRSDQKWTAVQQFVQIRETEIKCAYMDTDQQFTLFGSVRFINGNIGKLEVFSVRNSF